MNVLKAWKLCATRTASLRSTLCLRQVHLSKHVSNKPIEPVIRDSTGEDQFAEMMSDRTNTLLQSLGVDASAFEKPSNTDKTDDKSSSNTAVAEAANRQLTSTVTNSSPPSYFFDTQDVYSELRSAGLTPGQSEVIMRTMQDLIHELVKTCKDRSVPISAAANEAYLFDAASSEVRNEISNSRQIQSTTYRAGLARLQRDIEILEHEATEMTSSLKSDLDIEVHERKNATRAEENIIQLKIQDLKNKISTRLNSELKSEIENLRWQITRRSLAAIAVIAAMFIWLTQTSNRSKTVKSQERQRQNTGAPIPVPVLAASMSNTEDTYDTTPSYVAVEELPIPKTTAVEQSGDDSSLAHSSGQGETSNDK